MQIPGFRRNEQVIQKVVSRYIPKVTVIGGAFVGVLTLIASMFGVLGGISGTGLLLAVSIIYQLYEKLASQAVRWKCTRSYESSLERNKNAVGHVRASSGAGKDTQATFLSGELNIPIYPQAIF